MINQNAYGFGGCAPLGNPYSFGGGGACGFQSMATQFFNQPNCGGSYSNFGQQSCCPSFQPPPQFGNACGGFMNCAPNYGGQGFGSYPPMGCDGGQYGGGQYGGGQYGGGQYGGGQYGGGHCGGGQFGGGFLQGSMQMGELQLPGQQNKMWDVWFDSKDGQKTVQRSPIVLDLNGNGQADITGKNILGDGRIDGPTTMFDLDPKNVSYESKSQQRRPGSGAPDIKGGYWVDASGKRTEKSPPKGTQKAFDGYKYMDPKGQVVGEMKSDGLYHYGKQEKREQTEWLKKNGGDGFLVADYNKDGQINDATELFGTEGAQGQKYKNGYEKLAALHDTNKDGKLTGKELEGLQVWKDSNADGKVQDGELQSLKKHNITSFNVGNYDNKTMEGSYATNEQTIPFMSMSLVGGSFGGGYGGGGFGGQNPYGGGGYGGGGGFGGPSPFFSGSGSMFGFQAPWMGGYG